MAGIGEASAIITVAQVGISLSNSLIAYIGEVKDAHSRIHRIGNEVLTTSERLKDIGELVEKNRDTHILSEEAINSAVRCSSDCHSIIKDIKAVLCKSGWQQRPEAPEGVEIDISLFSTLRWPWLRLKLDYPRAELQRIKIDLSVIFSSAMALSASTAAEKENFKQSLPRLVRSKRWAMKKSEEAKRRAQGRPEDPNSWMLDGESFDDESDIFEEFISFQEKQQREREVRRTKERAALLKAEEDERKRLKLEAEREIERKAVERYKQEQEELQARRAESITALRNDMATLGIPKEKIELILESPNLTFRGDDIITDLSPGLAGLSLQQRSATTSASNVHPNSGIGGAKSRSNGRPRRLLQRWRSKKPVAENPAQRADNPWLSKHGNSRNEPFIYETWLMDVNSGLFTHLSPSDWLTTELSNPKTGRDIWHCIAKLRPWERTAIFHFVGQKGPMWFLSSIDFPPKRSRIRTFGQGQEERVLQLVICSKKGPNVGDASSERTTGAKSASRPAREKFVYRAEHEEGVNFNEGTKAINKSSNEEGIGETNNTMDQLRDDEEWQESLSDGGRDDKAHQMAEAKPAKFRHTPADLTNEGIVVRYGDHSREPQSPASFERVRPAFHRMGRRQRQKGKPEQGTWNGNKPYGPKDPPSRGIVLRDSREPPRERSLPDHVPSEYMRRENIRGERRPSTSGRSRALVLRAGGQRLPRDYIRDQILDRSIRVRNTYPHERSRPASRTSRSSSPDRDPSDDGYEKSNLRRRASATVKDDEDIIVRTLKRYTTFRGDALPATNTSAPPLAMSNDEASPAASAADQASILSLENEVIGPSVKSHGSDEFISVAPGDSTNTRLFSENRNRQRGSHRLDERRGEDDKKENEKEDD